MTDLNPDTHINSVTPDIPEQGETGTAQQIVDLIKARSA
jgi:hypothetical protein